MVRKWERLTIRSALAVGGVAFALGVAALTLGTDQLTQSLSTEPLLLSSTETAPDDGGTLPLPDLPPLAPILDCAILIGKQIPASAIALPTRGAIIATAVPVPATPVLPGFCQVTGAINAEKLGDPAILFQVNLPANWNQKALQFGGGSFNGTIPLDVLTLGRPKYSTDDVPTPLARGFTTFGGDSGHQGQPFDGTFGMNAQALANYASESVKRTHDVAMAVIKLYYGSEPRLTYHIGASKGGQEALVAAERYGADYDGIVAIHPVLQLPATAVNWQRMFDAAHRLGGYMNATEQALLKSAVMNACDGLDGIKDNLVSNVDACQFDVQTLRCPNGLDSSDSCLSDFQIDTLNQSVTPMRFAFNLAHGGNTDGPYPIFQGSDTSDLFGLEPIGVAGGYSLLSDPIIRYWIQQNPLSSARDFDYVRWQPRIEFMSAMFDVNNPNFDAFKKKGGKLIIVQGTTDTLVSHTMATAFVNSVKQRYGGNAKAFLRYYLQAGFGHGGGDYPLRWDSLTALDNWVMTGKAPVSPVGTAGQRTMPLCDHPAWPKYQGGNVNLASSFICTTK